MRHRNCKTSSIQAIDSCSVISESRHSLTCDSAANGSTRILLEYGTSRRLSWQPTPALKNRWSYQQPNAG